MGAEIPGGKFLQGAATKAVEALDDIALALDREGVFAGCQHKGQENEKQNPQLFHVRQHNSLVFAVHDNGNIRETNFSNENMVEAAGVECNL